MGWLASAASSIGSAVGGAASGALTGMGKGLAGIGSSMLGGYSPTQVGQGMAGMWPKVGQNLALLAQQFPSQAHKSQPPSTFDMLKSASAEKRPNEPPSLRKRSFLA